jgi:hypothetical protein
MTEAEWLASERAEKLLESLETRLTLRTTLLLGVACCRRAPLLAFFPEGRAAVDAAELLADGLLKPGERVRRQQAVREASEYALTLCPSDLAHMTPDNGAASYCAVEAAHFLINIEEPQVVGTSLELARDSIRYTEHHLRPRLSWEEHRIQCDLLRDIFGNPFRPVAFSPVWRTDTAVALARQMYEGRDFGAMPILADALQEAGCDSEDILDHCRGPGPHVRGCWVVDLVLGKE